MTDGAEIWPAAGRQLREACRLLIRPSPENLAHCLELLEAVAPSLRPVQDPAALPEAESLRELVKQAGILLEGAAGYHRGWAALAGSLTAGYAAGGRPGEYVPAGNLCLRA
jgi:hypothetical protein